MLIKALDHTSLNTDELQQQLLRQVDQLMAMDDNLASRLEDCADVLKDAVSADFAHLYLVDKVGNRLKAVTSHFGVGQAMSASLDRGFMGWALGSGISHVMMSEHEGQYRGNAYLPVMSTGPRGIILLENIATDKLTSQDLKQVLGSVCGLLGEMLLVEEGMGAQELLADLKMRIADASNELENGTQEQRVQTLLKLGMELTSAGAGVWVPGHGGDPTAAESENSGSSRLLSGVWPVLNAMSTRARVQGAHSWGISEDSPAQETPSAPCPYAAVKAKDTEDVLVLLFEPEDQAAYRQIPEGAVIDLMSRLVQHMPASPLPMEIRAHAESGNSLLRHY